VGERRAPIANLQLPLVVSRGTYHSDSPGRTGGKSS
jgi:hypothetical protein